VSPDGVVEALENPQHPFLVGVQCHPEDLYFTHTWSKRLFRGFIAHSAGE
jgi:putative glutamine amidotransferase